MKNSKILTHILCIAFIFFYSCKEAPIPGFTADKTIITEFETVTFTNQSLNNPDSWFWDFGDGQTSQKQAPQHIFTKAGEFSISLTTSNYAGKNTITKLNYIKVEETDEGCDTCETGTLSDIEGNTYKTIKIGEQWWMAENLRSTMLNDGTILYNGDSDPNKPSYWYYNDDKEFYEATFGALYNWTSVNTGKLCPDGWHVPTENEWREMENTVKLTLSLSVPSHPVYTASKLMARPALWGIHTSLYKSEYFGASGFDGRPGGFKNKMHYNYYFGGYTGMGERASWWMKNDINQTYEWGRCIELLPFNKLIVDQNNVNEYDLGKYSAFSVRCIQNK